MATAHVLINCDTGSERSVIEELKPTEGVKEVHGIFAAYDIIVKLVPHQRKVKRDNCVENTQGSAY